MSLNKQQFKDLIERVLKDVGLNSPEAVNLLLGTAAQESGFGTYIRQTVGPALGVFQMEPATFRDHCKWVFAQGNPLSSKVSGWSKFGTAEELEWNLAFAIVMCRIHYLRVPHPLPDANDVSGLAEYWKRYYNTVAGRGTVEQFIKNYKRYVD